MPTPAEQRPVGALKLPVEAADHGPLEPVEEPIGRQCGGRRHRGQRGAIRSRSTISGSGNGRQDPVDDVVGGDAVGERLVGEHEPVAENVRGELADVLGKGVFAPADERERPAGEDQVDRGARAGAERDEPRELAEPDRADVAGRGRELDGVLDQRRVDEDPSAARWRARSWSASIARLGGVERCRHPLDDDELLGRRRIADQHLEHEPVDLRLGQRVRALRLDRVLGRHHEERIGQPVGLAADRDLPLLHRLEQRALHLGGRAVDLVGEHEVREDRPERHLELTELLVEDPRADDVRRARGRA